MKFLFFPLLFLLPLMAQENDTAQSNPKPLKFYSKKLAILIKTITMQTRLHLPSKAAIKAIILPVVHWATFIQAILMKCAILKIFKKLLMRILKHARAYRSCLFLSWCFSRKWARCAAKL